MTPQESLNRFGTIFLSRKSIRALIGFGEPTMDGMEFKGFHGNGDLSQLNLDVLYQFIPEVYRDDFEAAVQVIHKEFAYSRCTDQTLDYFAVRLEGEMMALFHNERGY